MRQRLSARCTAAEQRRFSTRARPLQTQRGLRVRRRVRTRVGWPVRTDRRMARTRALGALGGRPRRGKQRRCVRTPLPQHSPHRRRTRV